MVSYAAAGVSPRIMGMVTMCVGTGQGAAGIFERL
jgi:hypothetical protein